MLRRAKPMLGTLTDIRVTDPGHADAQEAMTAAFRLMGEIDTSLSFHRPMSTLSALNARPMQWTEMGKHGARILRLARVLGKLSDNRFNVTLGGALVNASALPRHTLSDFLPCGSWEDIEINGTRARLKRPVLLTLDGIAKGYAVDMAVSCLKRFGVRSGSVNAGGDLKVFGNHPIKVQLRNSQGFTDTLWLKNAALASSRLGGEPDARFSSLIISQDGYPDNSPQTESLLSVIAPFAWRADALTKVLAFAGPEMVTRLGGRLPSLASPPDTEL
ncbi:FAD:protein FMN transferase [Shewanella amazonensis]|uniref:FAD:protein FMN transferase n=1 Tax=Shewanella amazonensis (strain ATCC BAA-1098 / SB2B) TaxID=326297 RepID=A1S903_SHEAM|nr:FAD:protein FMN transferase [Shewanella amazonensis]ABM00860.1 ApbE family protein, putative [Shewanella amazonensis SB2B]